MADPEEKLGFINKAQLFQYIAGDVVKDLGTLCELSKDNVNFGANCQEWSPKSGQKSKKGRPLTVEKRDDAFAARAKEAKPHTMPGRIMNEDNDPELPVAKMARFAANCEENQRPSNLVSAMILKAGRRALTPTSVKQIPLASGNILLADVNQFFASFIPGNHTNAKKTKAQEFFDYLIQQPTSSAEEK